MFEVTRVALTTGAATTTQNITITGFGTPKAAMFIVSAATADDTITANASLSIGFTDGTRDKCMGIYTDDGAAAMNTSRAQYNAVIVEPAADGASINHQFSFNAWVTDGVQIIVDNQAAGGYLCTVILFGDGVSNAYVNEKDDLGTGTSAVDITDPGFEPDLLFTCCIGHPTALDLNAAHAVYTFGCAINDGADTQRITAIATQDGVSTSSNTGYIGNTYGTGQVFNTSFSWGGTIGTFDSSGFSVTPNVSANSDIFIYLAIKFSAATNIDLFDMQIPTSGNYAETTPAFEPGFGFLSLIQGPSSRNSATGSNVWSVGFSAFDSSNVYTTSVRDEDARANANSDSQSSNKLAMVSENGGTAVDSSGYAFDSLGWDFTLTTNPGSAMLGWGLAVEGAAAPTVAVETAPETDFAAGVYPSGGQTGSYTLTTTALTSPVIRGTAEIDGSAVTLAVNFDTYTTSTLSGVWRVPTNPWEITSEVAFASSDTADANSYTDGPVVVYTNDGNLLAVFRRGGDHASDDGRLFKSISSDDGATWGAEVLVYDSATGYDTRNQAGGIDQASGRVVIFCSIYNKGGTTRDDAGYITSTDHGATWSAFTSVSGLFTDVTPDANYVPYGPMVRTSNGLMQLFYYHEDAWAIFSKDEGLTWGERVTIYTGYTPTNTIGEPSIVRIDDHRLVAIIRDNTTDNSFRYTKTSDGGDTWSAVTTTYEWTATTVTSAAPVQAITIEDDLLIAWGGRAPIFKVITNRMNKEDFWTTPQDAWKVGETNRTELYTAKATLSTNFGYPWIAHREGHEYTAMLFWYDQNLPTSDPTHTDIYQATFPRL